MSSLALEGEGSALNSGTGHNSTFEKEEQNDQGKFVPFRTTMVYFLPRYFRRESAFAAMDAGFESIKRDIQRSHKVHIARSWNSLIEGFVTGLFIMAFGATVLLPVKG